VRSRKPTLSAADRARALSAVRGMRQTNPNPSRSPAFDAAAGYKERQVLRQISTAHGIDDPTFRQIDGRPNVLSDFEGREVLNFGSYDYLGLNADPRPGNAAKDTIDRYGVSASASRLAGGQRPIHRELERALAHHYGVEDAITFVSGHATNVSVISTVTQKDDLIIYDAYIHNSASVGAELSAASRRSFSHNDLDALEALLEENVGRYRATLVVVEGHYSMDGDIPDLQRLLALKSKFGFWLMVDEAHGLGCVGATGKGIREVYNVAGTEVDIWMGTLSKTLGSTGGYVAGSAALIDIIKYEAPGSVYSVALSPPLAAAAKCSLSIMAAEPERVVRLHALGKFFLESAASHGLDTGTSIGSSIVPVITGSSAIAVALSMKLLERNINVLPIAFPGVPMNSARLRFFLTCEHTEAQISHALAETSSILAQLRNSPLADLN
jgi:8-amino-7-oxononanoate synthase